MTYSIKETVYQIREIVNQIKIQFASKLYRYHKPPMFTLATVLFRNLLKAISLLDSIDGAFLRK